MVNIILKRQRHYLGLSLLALGNIILAVGLITNASFFSQAVDRVVLLQELDRFSAVTERPPFSTQLYIFPSRRAPITLENAEQLGEHIAQTLASEVDLPLRHLGAEVNSGYLLLQPAPGSVLFEQGKENLGTVEAVYIAGIADQMQIIEGQPFDENGTSGDVMDVWIYDTTAQTMGVNIGEKLNIGLNRSNTKTPIQVTGIWKAKDPKAEFWFSNPASSYKKAIIVRRADYIARIQPLLGTGSGQVSWYVILDESHLVPKQSAHYLQGFTRSLEIINKFLPGARMNMPPLEPLEKFVARSSALTILLLGYNLPAFAILLYFLVLTSAIVAQWQRRETVMLVSRGMNLPGVIGLTLIEQFLLFIVGYPLGILCGMGVARLMGYTASFLSFTMRDPLPVSMEGLNLPLTALALMFALFSRLLPAVRAARSSLVTDERERARPVHKPFWFRFYLDILLLVPTGYAFDQMTKRGSLAGLVTDRPEDLFRDPLLVVVPALFILTTSLVAMRLFTVLMRLIDFVSGFVPVLTLHLALRQLGRESLGYVQPLLLVVIALAMGVYTLAMAASLDQWMVDRIYYRNGADLTFSPQPGESSSLVVDGSWIPLTSDFLSLPGVTGASRVGEFDLTVNPDATGQVRGRFLGIDRVEFPTAAWFRSDFASESLGSLMNRLAAAQEAVLVSETFFKQRQLQVGDVLILKVSIENVTATVSEYVVVGTYRYFPTVYEDELTIIGNLDYLATLTGLAPAHNIWLRLAPGTDTKALLKTIQQNYSVTPSNPRETRDQIRIEQERMERVGIFGTLTVSFLATALMSVLGLLIYSYASLHDRAYRLAVLNAVGLSRRQILIQVIFEYAFLALFGALAGAIIGSAAANLFVPFFRYTGELGIPLPPLLPIISGTQLRLLSLIFGLVIIGVEVITIGVVLQKRLAQILKQVWM